VAVVFLTHNYDEVYRNFTKSQSVPNDKDLAASTYFNEQNFNQALLAVKHKNTLKIPQRFDSSCNNLDHGEKRSAVRFEHGCYKMFALQVAPC